MELIVAGEKTFAATGDGPFDAAKPTLILLHGAGMDRTVWSLQTRNPAFSSHNVFAVDLPGHGLSAGKPLSSIKDMANWLIQFINKLGTSRVSVAGHSMGALVALSAAANAPEVIEKLALLGITVPMPVAAPLLEAAKANDITAIDMIINWAFAPANRLGKAPAPGLRIGSSGASLLKSARPGVLFADLNACNKYENGLKDAAAVKCPTLIVIGDNDRMARPKGAIALAETITGAKTAHLQGAGHMMMSEASPEVISALKAFLAG